MRDITTMNPPSCNGVLLYSITNLPAPRLPVAACPRWWRPIHHCFMLKSVLYIFLPTFTPFTKTSQCSLSRNFSMYPSNQPSHIAWISLTPKIQLNANLPLPITACTSVSCTILNRRSMCPDHFEVFWSMLSYFLLSHHFSY